MVISLHDTPVKFLQVSCKRQKPIYLAVVIWVFKGIKYTKINHYARSELFCSSRAHYIGEITLHLPPTCFHSIVTLKKEKILVRLIISFKKSDRLLVCKNIERLNTSCTQKKNIQGLRKMCQYVPTTRSLEPNVARKPGITWFSDQVQICTVLTCKSVYNLRQGWSVREKRSSPTQDHTLIKL